jgi:DNA-binding response OmpR family regulator
MHGAIAYKILTVEDDPITRADLRLVLEEAGFDVSDAHDGVQAVEHAREHKPDAILLDLGLPRLGGVEAAQQILTERSVPIVALTGRSRGLVEEALAVGVASYLTKPFVPHEVVDALKAVICADADAERVRVARQTSRDAIGSVCHALGYPPEYAAELEERAYRAGKLWHQSSGFWRSV